MRLAGRFARRVRASAAAHNIPVIDCAAGERKHLVAEEYLRDHTVGTGVFLILVARAGPGVGGEPLGNGTDPQPGQEDSFVNHYSFHIMDPTWGHLTIKMIGHPPFGAQIILNGHEYVACTAQAAGIRFAKEGNCFTRVDDPARLAQVADTLSQPGTRGTCARSSMAGSTPRACASVSAWTSRNAPGSGTATRSIRSSTPATCSSRPGEDGAGVRHHRGSHPGPARRAELTDPLRRRHAPATAGRIDHLGRRSCSRDLCRTSPCSRSTSVC